LGGKFPLAAFIFVLVMVALTGLPPTAGFNAKLLVFSAVWEAYQVNREPYLLWAFIAALLNTVIALFYYLKVPYYMYFKKAESESSIKLNTSENVFLCLMSIPLLVLFFKPDWLLDQLQKIVFNF
jgi:NADH-quinone oxidoreductase subunit N